MEAADLPCVVDHILKYLTCPKESCVRYSSVVYFSRLSSRSVEYHGVDLHTCSILNDFYFIISFHHPHYIHLHPCQNNRYYSSPKLALTLALHRLRNSFGSSLHILAASTFAGLSSFGLLSILITLNSIVSGVWTGDHRSEADSYP